MNFKIILLVAVLGAAACGVKNDPIPPITQEEIGRGKPLYNQGGQDLENKSKNEKDDVSR